MELIKTKDYDELSREAAKLVLDCVRKKPESTLVFPGGDTPIGMLNELVRAAESREIDFSGCSFISLDEWVGLDSQDEGSCRYTLDRYFFHPARIHTSQIYFFDAKASDLQLICRQTDEFIANKGGIDLIILGVGLNGHLGFNEPGTSWSLNCHIVQLDSVTKSVASKYFSGSTHHLQHGITLGIRTIMECQKVVLLASGGQKKEIVRTTVLESISEDLPASVLRKHPNCYLVADETCWDEDIEKALV